ncbi:lipase family protein [Methylobacterium aquaticum]|uniref:lipase family protein n=1 Tax=Methylobacterium aquaticum TaxID=270351 RepID=UPI003D1736C5
MTFASLDDRVLMTLAGIAYGDPGSIATFLAEAQPTAGWDLVWLAAPPDPPVNFAYLARDPSGGAAVLAIRGTYPDPFSSAYWDDGAEDSPFGDMMAWPSAPGAAISAGTARALATLLALTDASGTTLEAAVAALPAGCALTVTGHSLGGTLAPVLALHLAESDRHRVPAATSYAGMTPGNQAFAALFGPGTSLDGRVRRVFNTLDTVSYGWDRVLETHSFYEPAPRGGPVVAAMLLVTQARLTAGGYDFAPVGEAVALDGVLRPPSVSCELVAYVLENLHQHMPDTYLALLGAPPLPFSIGFGTQVVPRSHPAAARPLSPHPPVVYVAPGAG